MKYAIDLLKENLKNERQARGHAKQWLRGSGNHVRDADDIRAFEESLSLAEKRIPQLEDAKYEIETLRGQIVDRDMEIKELKEDMEELSDTLGLRNRSNPDLTIDDEQPKSIFDRWKDCKD